jgi:hypothetical protein
LKAEYRPTDDEVRTERQRRYLELWPVEKQMEAHTEAAMGRPEKVNEMPEDFAEIRRVLPFFKEGE